MTTCLLTESFAADQTSTTGMTDFSGEWFYGSATPYERPLELGDRMVYSDREAAVLEATLAGAELTQSNPDRAAPPKGAVIGQEADHNFAPDRVTLTRIDGEARTSLIVSPRNGRLPLRPDGDTLVIRIAR